MWHGQMTPLTVQAALVEGARGKMKINQVSVKTYTMLPRYL